jgi:hypothetical protein
MAYVERLMASIQENISMRCNLVCLTDCKPKAENHWVIERMHDGPSRYFFFNELEHDWPGWWSKIELFRLPPPVLYFDLDTVIMGDITPLAKWVMDDCNGMMMLRGFYKSDQCSGIMGWRRDLYEIYNRFKDRFAPNANFQSNRLGVSMTVNNRKYRGDQDWLRVVLPSVNVPVVLAQDVFSGVYSYKVNIQGKVTPDDARIICFHGKPRPHEVEAIV